MRKLFFISLVLIMALLGGGSSAKEKGHLLIIGGGAKPPDALVEFVTLSRSGHILIITSASGEPESYGPAVVEQFKQAGAKNVHWLHIDSPEMANADSVVTRIESSTGIFFTGGIQERLMQRLGGTRSEAAVATLYFEKGGIIGGTSAGAAVMSEVMITGNELINKDTTDVFFTIQAGNIETKPGFGFLKKVIIDQHFIARKRHNRLISLVLEHPKLAGIGIDEDTAILVSPDDSFRVIGTGSVVIYDARKAKSVRMDQSGLLAGQGLTMSILLAGDKFRL
ncbi:MAG: cyanophycinase [Candidatus Zhuqueibacterota bacterium]